MDRLDPRIAELADAMADLAAHSRRDNSPGETSASLAAVALMASAHRRRLTVLETAERALREAVEALRSGPGGPVTGTIEIRGPRLVLRALRASEIDGNGRRRWTLIRWLSPGRLMSRVSAPGWRQSGRLADGQLDLAIDLDGLLIGRIQTFVPPGRPLPPGTFDVGIGLREHARAGDMAARPWPC